MNKKTTKQFYEYYNRWVRPFVVNAGDNLLESEGPLYSLINSVREELINIAFTELSKWVYNDENQAGDKLQIVDASDFPEIFKAITNSKPQKKRGGCDGEQERDQYADSE